MKLDNAGGLGALKDVLLRPLWVEDEVLRDRRRCHLLVALPLVAIAGAAYGFLVAPELGVGPLFGVVLGTVAFSVFLHVQLTLEPVVTHFFGRRGRAEPLVPFLWDVGLGGILAYLVTERLGAPVMPAVTTATAAGGVYAVVTGYMFCGGGVADLVDTVFAARGSSTPHRNEHSRAAALAARGDAEAAVFEYRLAIESDPRDPVPYLHLARLLSRQLGRHEDALALLRRGLREARSTQEEEALLVRHIAELCEQRLRDPIRAAPDLARLSERQPDTLAGAWSRQTLARLKEELTRPTGPEAEPPPGAAPPSASPPAPSPSPPPRAAPPA